MVKLCTVCNRCPQIGHISQVITGPLFINLGWMMHFVILIHVYICTWQAVMLCLYAWSIFCFYKIYITIFLDLINLFLIKFKKIIDRNHLSVLYISFFISKNAFDHLITFKFPDCSVYRWLQIWPWHPLQSVISRKRWKNPMLRPLHQSLKFLMINWWKLLNTWTDLLEVNCIQIEIQVTIESSWSTEVKSWPKVFSLF